ncbi:MAG: hypothetical protein U5K51_13650 [Flavobacteriaceae bacterium]|nr:hypothetical protein [Flavobacteriaceae bacterium]
MVTTGVNVIKILSNIKADICFLGTSGLDPEEGITEVGYEVSFVKRVMVASSKTVVSMVTSDKLNTAQRYPVCDLTEIQKIITELPPNDPVFYPYIKKGIEIM